MWPLNLIKDLVSGILAPLFSWLNKKEDTKVVESNNDVSVIQSRNTLLGQIHRDPVIAVGWYLFIVPTGVWYAAIVLYCLVHPWVSWWKTVTALPPNIEYIPYAVIAFLFGLAYRGKP